MASVVLGVAVDDQAVFAVRSLSGSEVERLVDETEAPDTPVTERVSTAIGVMQIRAARSGVRVGRTIVACTDAQKAELSSYRFLGGGGDVDFVDYVLALWTAIRESGEEGRMPLVVNVGENSVVMNVITAAAGLSVAGEWRSEPESGAAAIVMRAQQLGMQHRCDRFVVVGSGELADEIADGIGKFAINSVYRAAEPGALAARGALESDSWNGAAPKREKRLPRHAAKSSKKSRLWSR